MFNLLYDILIWFILSYATFRVMKFLYIITLSIYGHFFCKELDLTEYKKYWTVVTGCTDGIGRAYIEELAKTRGLRKFYLIGRNEKKLQIVCDEMKNRYNCEIKTALFDFESDDYIKLPIKDLTELPIGILVNCVGIAPVRVANFEELSPSLPSKILRVNTMSTIKMIEFILPGMLNRNFGIIVNVSSITGWRPLPYMSTYPASKAAISFFSNALNDELSHKNVKIQCLIPLLVATKIASYEAEESNWFVIDANTYARQAVHVMGKWNLSTGCFLHDVQIAFGSLIGFWLFKQIFVPTVMLGWHKRRIDKYQFKKMQQIKEDGFFTEASDLINKND